MTVVLDASAVIAVLRSEQGADRVQSVLGNAMISAVNLQEVFKELLEDNIAPDLAHAMVQQLQLDVCDHDETAALHAAALHTATKRYGRGIGDRSCMSLAISKGVPVLTADKEWARVEVDGLDIVFIR